METLSESMKVRVVMKLEATPMLEKIFFGFHKSTYS